MIEDRTATWDQFLAPTLPPVDPPVSVGDPRFNSVKSYVYLKVKMLFDPPGVGYVLTAMEKMIQEAEWRIDTMREDIVNPAPPTVVAPDTFDPFYDFLRRNMDYDFVEIHDDHAVSRKVYTRTDPRLGRNVARDSRSLAYQVQAKDVSTLKWVQHKRNIPVLDQGDLGSCTGNAGTGAVGCAMFWDVGSEILNPTDAQVDETYAINLYAEATTIDNYGGTYPPTDTGSRTVSPSPRS